MWTRRRSLALVQRSAPEWEKRCRPDLKATNASWRVDETSVTIKGVWMDWYRAVDLPGNTLAFHRSTTRDTQAAKPFFGKALQASHTVIPRGITVDRNAADPKALTERKAASPLPACGELRQSNYLNHLLEQDHRAHQTARQAWDGLLFLRDRMANVPGLRDHADGEKRTRERREQGGYAPSRGSHLPSVWTPSLN